MNKEQAQKEREALIDRITELDKIIAEPAITKEQRFWQIINSITSVKVDKKQYSNSTFFFAADILLFEYNANDEVLWCSYNYVWSVFKKDFGMGYAATQILVKGMVEEHFKCKGVTAGDPYYSIVTKVEEHFKCKGVSPMTALHITNGLVEEHFKCKG